MKKKNLLKLPKQEDVEEFDFGNMKASLVEITDENRDAILETVLEMYMDDVCMYCLRNFTYEEVKESIWAHENPHGRIAHKECWNANH